MTDDQIAKPKRRLRWYQPSPGRLLFLLLPVEAILFFLNWLQWTPKGWAVLIAIAAVALVIIVLLLWFSAAVLFRRRFQFSVRSLVILTVAIAVPCSWLTAEMKAAKDQMEAVAAIQPPAFGVTPSSGIGVRYWFPQIDDIGHEGPAPEPEWLIRRLGTDFFHDVTLDVFHNKDPKKATDEQILKNINGIPRLKRITFFDDNVGGDGLPSLAKFRHLKFLEFYCSNIADRDLVYLKDLQELESLTIGCERVNDNISPTAVSDDGPRHLAGLKSLKSLELVNTRVTGKGVTGLQLESLSFCGAFLGDEDLRDIATMNGLKALFLDNCRLGETGMASIGWLPRLTTLSLSGTNVGDAGLAKLQDAQQLTHLDLSETPIGNAGMKYLPTFVNLRFLNLTGTQITDEGLLSLRGMDHLESINLSGCAGWEHGVGRATDTTVTDEGVQKLQKALPNCEITFY
jgi:hypothetical protein